MRIEEATFDLLPRYADVDSLSSHSFLPGCVQPPEGI